MALSDISGVGDATDGYKAAQIVLDISLFARRGIDRLQRFVDDNGVVAVCAELEAASAGSVQETVDVIANVVLVANHNLGGETARVAPIDQSHVV